MSICFAAKQEAYSVYTVHGIALDRRVHSLRKARFMHVSGGIVMRTNLPETARRHHTPRRARLRSLRGIPRAPESVG